MTDNNNNNLLLLLLILLLLLLLLLFIKISGVEIGQNFLRVRLAQKLKFWVFWLKILGVRPYFLGVRQKIYELRTHGLVLISTLYVLLWNLPCVPNVWPSLGSVFILNILPTIVIYLWWTHLYSSVLLLLLGDLCIRRYFLLFTYLFIYLVTLLFFPFVYTIFFAWFQKHVAWRYPPSHPQMTWFDFNDLDHLLFKVTGTLISFILITSVLYTFDSMN